MIKFLCKRLLQSVLIIWGVLTVVFILIHLAPGDPTSIYIRPDIDPKIVQDIRHNLGLDLPLWKQYLVWIPHFFMGDFGVSFVHHRPVTDILRETIPNTLQLTLVVFVSQFIIGILLGIYLA
ncbi:MAG: ABC transporter permease, partial [Calditrichaeota bacterium]